MLLRNLENPSNRSHFKIDFIDVVFLVHVISPLSFVSRAP